MNLSAHLFKFVVLANSEHHCIFVRCCIKEAALVFKTASIPYLNVTIQEPSFLELNSRHFSKEYLFTPL